MSMVLSKIIQDSQLGRKNLYSKHKNKIRKFSSEKESEHTDDRGRLEMHDGIGHVQVSFFFVAISKHKFRSSARYMSFSNNPAPLPFPLRPCIVSPLKFICRCELLADITHARVLIETLSQSAERRAGWLGTYFKEDAH